MPKSQSVNPEIFERIASLEADMSWVKKMHFLEIVMLIVVLVKVLVTVS